MGTAMEVPRYDLFVKQGVDWEMTIVIEDENGSPKDLTGHSFALMIRQEVQKPAAVSLSSPSSGIVVTPATGTVVITMTNAQTAGIRFLRGVYDLIDTVSSVKTCILEGDVVVSPLVTR